MIETSNKINEEYLKLAISVGSWFCLAFFLIPMILNFAKELTPQLIDNTNISGSITILFYYVLNPIIATILVRKQNTKLKTKTVEFRQKYNYSVSGVILVLFVLNYLIL